MNGLYRLQWRLNMRTIEGWTKKEQQELERLFDYCDDTVGNMGAMYAMYLIIRGPEEFHSITFKD